MKYRIYPQKSDVLAMFLARQERIEQTIANLEMRRDGVLFFPNETEKTKEDIAFHRMSLEALKDEIALIQSHGPAEIAVEIED